MLLDPKQRNSQPKSWNSHNLSQPFSKFPIFAWKTPKVGFIAFLLMNIISFGLLEQKNFKIFDKKNFFSQNRTLIWQFIVLINSLNHIYITWKGNLKLNFFTRNTWKAHEIWYFYILDLVLVLRYLFLQQMSKFPDIRGFWEFPKDSKVIPIHVQNSQELGKFPKSSHTELERK